MEINIAVAQPDIPEESGKYEAQDVIIQQAEQAGSEGADLIVFPEMSPQPFFPAFVDDKQDIPGDVEPIPGPSVDNIRDVADEQDLVIVYPELERSDEDFFSSAAVLDTDGTLDGVYRRIHRDTSGELNESWMSVGDTIPVIETNVGTIGIMIGHDRHFPEQSRILGLHGADVICCPAAGYGEHRETWELELRAHTVAQGVFLAVANRFGHSNDLSFFGESLIIDPRGKVQGKLGREHGVNVVDCDLEEIREVRDVWQFFRDRRPETYGEMLEEHVPEHAS